MRPVSNTKRPVSHKGSPFSIFFLKNALLDTPLYKIKEKNLRGVGATGLMSHARQRS